MYLYGNIEAISCNHCYSSKTINTTNTEFVFLALSIPHEMRMRHIVHCSITGFALFFHIIL